MATARHRRSPSGAFLATGSSTEFWVIPGITDPPENVFPTYAEAQTAAEALPVPTLINIGFQNAPEPGSPSPVPPLVLPDAQVDGGGLIAHRWVPLGGLSGPNSDVPSGGGSAGTFISIGENLEFLNFRKVEFPRPYGLTQGEPPFGASLMSFVRDNPGPNNTLYRHTLPSLPASGSRQVIALASQYNGACELRDSSGVRTAEFLIRSQLPNASTGSTVARPTFIFDGGFLFRQQALSVQFSVLLYLGEVVAEPTPAPDAIFSENDPQPMDIHFMNGPSAATACSFDPAAAWTSWTGAISVV